MSNLIKSEVYKLLHSKVFRNSCITMGIMAFFTIFTRFIFNDAPIYLMHTYIGDRSYGFLVNGMGDLGPVIYLKNALGGIAIVIIVSIFLVGVAIVNEFTGGTIKNSVSYGHNRTQIYLSKIIGSSIVVLGMTTVYCIVSLIGSALFYGWGEPFAISRINDMIKMILLVDIILIGIISINICLAVIIKSKALLEVVLMAMIFITATTIADPIPWFLKFNPFFMLMDVCAEIPSMNIMAIYTINTVILVIISSIIGVSWFKNQDIK